VSVNWDLLPVAIVVWALIALMIGWGFSSGGKR
jgi:hypothetical protein